MFILITGGTGGVEERREGGVGKKERTSKCMVLTGL